MEKQNFRDLRVSGLRNAELVALCDSVAKIFDKHVGEDIDPILRKIADELNQQNQIFRASIQKDQGSAMTQRLRALDDVRDEYSQEFLREIKHQKKSRSVAKKEAADALDRLMKPYGIFYRKALDIQTADIRSFLDKIHTNSELQTAIQTLHLNEVITALRESNEQFDALYLERNCEYGDTQSQKILAYHAKPDLMHSYLDLCQYLSILYRYNKDSLIEKLFYDIDLLRREYHALLERRKPKSVAEQQADLKAFLDGGEVELM